MTAIYLIPNKNPSVIYFKIIDFFFLMGPFYQIQSEISINLQVKYGMIVYEE